MGVSEEEWCYSDYRQQKAWQGLWSSQGEKSGDIIVCVRARVHTFFTYRPEVNLEQLS